jgi:hypothetical protein
MSKSFLPTVMAMIAGFLVLLGSFVPIEPLPTIRIILVRWATIVAAFALLLAYVSVVRVHLGRLFQKRAPYRFASAILLVTSVAILVLVIVEGPNHSWVQTWLQVVLVPGQSALLALTAVTLALAGTRLLRTRRTLYSILFLLGALIALLAAVPVAYPPVFNVVMQFVDAVATGGIRGLLLGVVLGILLIGLRIILGIDRPHSGG